MIEERFCRINLDNAYLLERFIQNLGSSKITFRYFQKRDITVIKNHLVTCVLLCKDEPVAYGHLEKQNDICWLGIAVIEKEVGKGFGNKMLGWLIQEAEKLKIQIVSLTVDNDNLSAIRLYEKFNFRFDSKINSISKYKLIIGEPE